MWTYSQKTGDLLHNDALFATGYSGCDEGKNNPELQAVHDLGPIPCGTWEIIGPPVNTSQHGPFVLALVPASGTETFGRTGFLLHGDSVEAPGCASRGCIIMARNIREEIWKSGDRDLHVVADVTQPETEGGTAA